MNDYDVQFTPESVDEQVEQLLSQSRKQGNVATPQARMARDLQNAYDDEEIFAHVWSDLVEHIENKSSQQDIQGRQPEHQIANLNYRSAKPLHRAGLSRLSLIAAVLLTAVVVGSMLVVLTLARQSTRTASPSLASPAGIYLSNEDTVFKLDTQTRKVLWQQALKNVVKIIPAGNTVYLLQGNIATAGESAVLALDVKSGRTLWKHPFSLQTSDMVLSQNLLYVSVENWPAKLPVGTKDAGKVYVLNAQDGSQHALYSPIDSAWSLVVGDGVLGVSTDTGLRAYDTVTGKLLWQKPLTASSRPKVDAMHIVDGLLYASVDSSYVTAYKGRTGDNVWQSPTLSNISSFTIDHQIIYFGTSTYLSEDKPLKGAVYAYDVQGKKQLWSQQVDGGPQQTPVISNGMVYVATDSASHFQAHIVALMATTGAIKWQKPLDNKTTEAFSLSNGVLYVGNVSDLDHPPAPNTLDALSPADGRKLWEDTRFGAAQVIVPTE